MSVKYEQIIKRRVLEIKITKQYYLSKRNTRSYKAYEKYCFIKILKNASHFKRFPKYIQKVKKRKTVTSLKKSLLKYFR